MKTLKITTNNRIKVVDIDFGDYEAIQEELGGHFETVKTRWIQKVLGEDALMLVDEEGRLKSLPMNPAGSLFYGTIEHGQPIVGDALLAVVNAVGDDFTAPSEERLMEWKEILVKRFALKEEEGSGNQV